MRGSFYGLGAFGACAATFPAGTLVLYFLTNSIGLSIGLATLVITLPKVWDIVVDPAIGALIDRFSRRRNERFTAIAISALGLPLSAAAVFVLPHASGLLIAALATLMLIAMSTFYTIYWVTHLAAANDIDASGQAPRNTLLAFRMIGQAGGGLFAGAVAPLLLGLKFRAVGGYPLMAVCLSIVAILALAVCAASLRNIATTGAPQAPKAKLNFVTGLRDALGRPRALGLILSNFAVSLACAYLGTLMAYVNKYLLHNPDTSLSMLFSTLMAAQVAGAALAAVIARSIGTQRGFVASTFGLLLAGLTFFAGSQNLWVLLPALALWGASTGAYTVLLHSSLLDTAKEDAAGAGVLGLLLGLLFSFGKIGETAGGVVSAASLSSAGGIVQLSHSENARAILRLWVGIAPAVLIVLGMVAVYVLDARTKAENDTV